MFKSLFPEKAKSKQTAVEPFSSHQKQTNETHSNPSKNEIHFDNSEYSLCQGTKSQLQQTAQKIQNLQEQNQELTETVSSLKEMLIEMKVSHDQEIRAYDELIEELKEELERQKTIGKFQERICWEHQNEDNEDEEAPTNFRQNGFLRIDSDVKKGKTEELIANTNWRLKYNEAQTHCLSLEKQLSELKQKYQKHFLMAQSKTDEKSIEQNTTETFRPDKSENPGEAKAESSSLGFRSIFFNFQQEQISEIADFSYPHTNDHNLHQEDKFSHSKNNGDPKYQSVVPNEQSIEEEILVREERIENLERNQVELKHQLATMSHKLANLFNAALEFGGDELIDHLQEAIGLFEASNNSQGVSTLG